MDKVAEENHVDGEKPDVDVPPKRERVNRMDSIELPWFLTKKFTRTTEGFLSGKAVVTSIGVFEYKDADGNIYREARLPEEVFAYDSLKSMALKPLVMDHPNVAVTSANVKEFQIGNLGSEATSSTQMAPDYDFDDLTDGIHVAIDLIVQDEAAIQQVLNGKTALSCGYSCDVEPAEPDARYLGMPYDWVQRNIRYNHVAIVDQARAGGAAAIVLDRLDAASSVITKISARQGKGDPMKKINLDGVEYDAEAKVIETLNQERTRADSVTAELTKTKETLSKVEADRDSFKERLDSAVKELEVAKATNLDAAAVDAHVKQRIEVISSAQRFKVPYQKDGVYFSDGDIRKAIIIKAFPKAVLDGKDHAYLAARFDSAIEILAEKEGANVQTAILGASELPSDLGDGLNSDGVENAREKMVAEIRKRSDTVQNERS